MNDVVSDGTLPILPDHSVSMATDTPSPTSTHSLSVPTEATVFASSSTVPPPGGNATYMPADPDKTAYGVIICISIPVLLLVLYMSVFGRRMKWTAVRWHVINCAVWGMFHLASTASFQEKAPFPNWIRDQEWADKKVQVECLTRSIFPAGMFFIYIEQMLLVCSPRLARNRVFNLIFAFFLIGLINSLVVFCFAAQYMDIVWWYNPIELFNLFTYMLFCTMSIVYFFFCLFGSCCCCFVLLGNKKSSKTPITFIEMWLLFPYGLLPNIMYGPSFGVTSVGFVMKVFMKWIMDSGLIEKFMGSHGSGNFGPFDMQTMIDMMINSLKALPWFVFLFPLVQAILAIACLTPYREQFLFLVTCGRFYHGKKQQKEELKKEWSLGGIAPYPIFPRNEGEPLKMEHASQ